MSTKTKMRIVFLVIVSTVLAGCGRKSVRVQPPSSQPTEDLIRLRAQQIELEEKIKQAEKITREGESSATKQARNEVEKEQKRKAKNEKDSLEAYYAAGVSNCGIDKIQIEPGAVKGISFFIGVRYTFTNLTGEFLDIRDDLLGRTVVHNLCPHGIVSLTKRLIDYPGDNQIVVSYSVNGKVNGVFGVAHSPTFTLYSGQAQWNPSQSVKWDIHGLETR